MGKVGEYVWKKKKDGKGEVKCKKGKITRGEVKGFRNS